MAHTAASAAQPAAAASSAVQPPPQPAAASDGSGANGAAAQNGPGQAQPAATPLEVIAWVCEGQEHLFWRTGVARIFFIGEVQEHSSRLGLSRKSAMKMM